MVNESTPPKTLSERNLSAIADYIKSGIVKRIVVMTGAGISTAAGSRMTSRASYLLPLTTTLQYRISDRQRLDCTTTLLA